MARQEELQKVIDGLRQSVPEIRGVMIATTDGLAIAHSINSGDPNRVAAMAATALGIGKRISDTLEGGSFEETMVVGKDGQVFMYSAGGKGVLAITASRDANVGLIHLEARPAGQSVARILSE